MQFGCLIMSVFLFLHDFSVHAVCDYTVEINQDNTKVHPINVSLQDHLLNEKSVAETNRLLKCRWFFRKLSCFSGGVSKALFCCSAGLYTLTLGSAGNYPELSTAFFFASNACLAFNFIFFGIASVSSTYLGKVEGHLQELAEDTEFNLAIP